MNLSLTLLKFSFCLGLLLITIHDCWIGNFIIIKETLFISFLSDFLLDFSLTQLLVKLFSFLFRSPLSCQLFFLCIYVNYFNVHCWVLSCFNFSIFLKPVFLVFCLLLMLEVCFVNLHPYSVIHSFSVRTCITEFSFSLYFFQFFRYRVFSELLWSLNIIFQKSRIRIWFEKFNWCWCWLYFVIIK